MLKWASFDLYTVWHLEFNKHDLQQSLKVFVLHNLVASKVNMAFNNTTI